MGNTNKVIVAEVAKTWTLETPEENLLCQQFESVINTNMARGYQLVDWKFTTVVSANALTETIIAIFSLKEEPFCV